MAFDFSRLPVINHRKLWHIGTLNPADKGCRGTSQEGNGLSVSLHPDEWEAIARLGGNPRWQLHRTDGAPGRFIAFHRISRKPRAELVREAELRGWLAQVERFRLAYFDPEVEERRYILFESKEKAQVEREDISNWASAIRLTRVMVSAPTPVLAALVGQKLYDGEGLDMV